MLRNIFDTWVLEWDPLETGGRSSETITISIADKAALLKQLVEGKGKGFGESIKELEAFKELGLMKNSLQINFTLPNAYNLLIKLADEFQNGTKKNHFKAALCLSLAATACKTATPTQKADAFFKLAELYASPTPELKHLKQDKKAALEYYQYAVTDLLKEPIQKKKENAQKTNQPNPNPEKLKKSFVQLLNVVMEFFETEANFHRDCDILLKTLEKLQCTIPVGMIQTLKILVNNPYAAAGNEFTKKFMPSYSEIFMSLYSPQKKVGDAEAICLPIMVKAIVKYCESTDTDIEMLSKISSECLKTIAEIFSSTTNAQTLCALQLYAPLYADSNLIKDINPPNFNWGNWPKALKVTEGSFKISEYDAKENKSNIATLNTKLGIDSYFIKPTQRLLKISLFLRDMEKAIDAIHPLSDEMLVAQSIVEQLAQQKTLTNSEKNTTNPEKNTTNPEKNATNPKKNTKYLLT